MVVYKIHYVTNTYNQGEVYGLFYGKLKGLWPAPAQGLEFKIEERICVPKDFPDDSIFLISDQILKADLIEPDLDYDLDVITDREKLLILRSQLV